MGILDIFKSSDNSSYQAKLKKYSATEEEIKIVTEAINKKKYWEEHTEWRISTVTSSKIKPLVKDGVTWFITTVKCEQEVMIPAATIEQAIVFKKIYEDFFIELFYTHGWASNANDKPK
jgi:hypothetical protein